MKNLPEEIKVNKIIAELIQSHGYEVTFDENGKILPNFKEKIEIDSWVYPQSQEEDYLVTRLDVGIQLPNGKELYEGYGDIGNDLEDCISKNLDNFSRSSLHTILDAFNDTQTQTHTEEWDLHGGKYTAYIGDYQTKTLQEEKVEIPTNLKESLQQLLSNYNWEEDYYFVRFFYSYSAMDSSQTIELMVNNINLEKEEQELKKLNWNKKSVYYSIRLFMILKREK